MLWPAVAALLASHAGAKDCVLVLRPEGPNFLEAVKGLRSELGTELDVEDAPLKQAGAAEEAAAAKRVHPKAVVLMDNGIIEAWRNVEEKWNDTVAAPPAIAMMAVRVDRTLSGLKNVEGISYEVPGLTIMLLLRSLMEEPVQRVGVVHTAAMTDFVAGAAKWLESEKITLVPIVVGSGGDAAKDVRKAIWQFQNKESVDALWILNDNQYLNMEVVRKGWLPALADFRAPVVVGVENLVTPRIRFGTFAVLPDHYGLGVQAAGLILNLEADGWRMQKPGSVEPPMAVHKILNVKAARERFRMRAEVLEQMDKLLE